MFVVRVVVPVIVSVAAGLLVSGCVGSGGPAPTPSPMCTPEAGGVEFRCSEAEFEAMKARDALYAEAEAVNEKYQAILDRIYREGAPEEMPEDLKAITAGSARTDVEDLLSNLHEVRITLIGGEMRQVWVKRNLASREGSVVSLSVCIDSRTVDVFQGGESIGQGHVSLEDTFFKMVDGELKVWAVDGKSVESCE